MQNFVASIAGASASLIVSAPLDVIKTRIQNRNFDNPESGFRIVGSMIRNEGLTSFFKGLVPKVCWTSPDYNKRVVLTFQSFSWRVQSLSSPSGLLRLWFQPLTLLYPNQNQCYRRRIKGYGSVQHLLGVSEKGGRLAPAFGFLKSGSFTACNLKLYILSHLAITQLWIKKFWETLPQKLLTFMTGKNVIYMTWHLVGCRQIFGRRLGNGCSTPLLPSQIQTYKILSPRITHKYLWL